MVDKKGKYSFNAKDGWYGVDLDGTLAYLDSSTFPVIGKPIPLILDKVKELLSLNKRVKIFTARASEKKEIIRIKKWLKENDLPNNLEITNVKDYLCIQIWDDRARRVLLNTGYFVDGDVTRDILEMKQEFEKNLALTMNEDN